MARYPFPIPYGWFQVAWPDELPVGKAKALYYFGRHLVGWRDEEGTAHILPLAAQPLALGDHRQQGSKTLIA